MCTENGNFNRPPPDFPRGFGLRPYGRRGHRRYAPSRSILLDLRRAKYAHVRGGNRRRGHHSHAGRINYRWYADTRHARFGRPTWAHVETSAHLRVRRRRTGGRRGRRPRRAAVTAGEPHSVWASNDLFQNDLRQNDLRGLGLRPCGRREHRRCAPSHMRRRRRRRRRWWWWWWWRWRRRRQRRRAAEAACCGGVRVACGSPHVKQRTAAAAVMVVVISVCGGRWGWES